MRNGLAPDPATIGPLVRLRRPAYASDMTRFVLSNLLRWLTLCVFVLAIGMVPFGHRSLAAEAEAQRTFLRAAGAASDICGSEGRAHGPVHCDACRITGGLSLPSAPTLSRPVFGFADLRSVPMATPLSLRPADRARPPVRAPPLPRTS